MQDQTSSKLHSITPCRLSNSSFSRTTSVQPVTQRALITHPWAATCALLVIPQCRSRFLSSSASKPIQEYLEDGGAYLGLGTGALYSPPGRVTGLANLNFGISSGESTRLRFFDKFNSSYIYPETSGGEGTPGLAQLRLPDGQALTRVFDAGIGEFVGFEDAKGVVVLAHYADREGAAAGVAIDVCGGKIALWSPNIEYPLSEEPASSLLAQSTPPEVESLEVGRRKLLKATLIQLGLQIPEREEGKSIARPLPQFLTSTPTKPHIVSTIIQALSPSSQLGNFKDANDTFEFVSLADSSKLLEETRANVFTPSDPSTWQPKHIVLCSNGELPPRKLTPLFDLDLFFRSLAIAREHKNLTTDPESTSWGVGEALLYGEAITSTQTMLDK
jgi:biotin--protein ligase